MYHYPHHYPVYYARGGGRRIWWFMLGGIAATLFIKYREREGRTGDALQCSWRRGTIRDSDKSWTEERERLARIGAQAGDKVMDVSETALDSILTTVEALKQKLIEQRLARQERKDEGNST